MSKIGILLHNNPYKELNIAVSFSRYYLNTFVFTLVYVSQHSYTSVHSSYLSIRIINLHL